MYDYWILYFRINATIAKIMTKEPRDGSIVASLNPNGVKLKISPVRAVMAKLNPMEKVTLSMKSNALFSGNNVSVRQ